MRDFIGNLLNAVAAFVGTLVLVFAFLVIVSECSGTFPEEDCIVLPNNDVLC